MAAVRDQDTNGFVCVREKTSSDFRHASGYKPEILGLLTRHDVPLRLSDHRGAPAPWVMTASHVYGRGHGPTGAYKGHYSDATLHVWARDIAAWRRGGRTVYIYFDNDQKSAARPMPCVSLIS